MYLARVSSGNNSINKKDKYYMFYYVTTYSDESICEFPKSSLSLEALESDNQNYSFSMAPVILSASSKLNQQ
jgi:hypothetical protein